MGWAAVVVFKVYEGVKLGAAKAQLGNILSVQLLVVSCFVLWVLRSAASRNRLNGTTFRMLSLGLVVSSAIAFLDSVYEGQQLILAGSWTWDLLPYGVAALASLLTVLPSYGTLLKHSVPSFKMDVESDRGVSLLAIGYAIVAVHSVWWGSSLVLRSPLKVVGALRAFVVAACAQSCQTAAVAGKKRLSSETYRLLNLAMTWDSLLRLLLVWHVGRTPQFYILPSIGLACSAGGFAIGATVAGKK